MILLVLTLLFLNTLNSIALFGMKAKPHKLYHLGIRGKVTRTNLANANQNRDYIDYKRLYRLNKDLSYFIIRAKRNLKFKRLYSNNIDKSTGLRCDQVVKLTGFYQMKDYLETLKRVKFFDSEIDKRFVFLTNNFELA